MADVRKLLALTATCQLSLVIILGPKMAKSLLEIQVTCFTAARFRAIVGAWSNLDRARFASHYAVDVWYPLVYGTLMWRRAEELADRRPDLLKLLKASAFLGALLDVAENAMHIRAFCALGTEDVPDALVCAAGVCAVAKWVINLALCVILRPWQSPWPALADKEKLA
mmetsp:Transcript_6307/g.21597  ORF Transcript_6307/g.21597 Transcript_6307/m.21597 type:complete len:168 (-) Transcript_6307:309-812(-)